MTPDFEKRMREAAEEWALHQSKNNYRCPVCAEETLWTVVADDFEAGARWAREEALEEIASMVEKKAEEAKPNHGALIQHEITYSIAKFVFPGLASQIRALKTAEHPIS